MMIFDILRLISFLISVSAVIFGIIIVSKNKIPMYFKFMVGTALCYMLRELYIQISYICGNLYNNTIVEMLAVVGSVLFLFSAEYGLIDKIVDDGSTKKVKKLVSCTIPMILIFGYVIMLAARLSNNHLKMLACGLIVLLMVFASYLNMKHLIMEEDEVGFLKSSRSCNICAIIYYFGLEVLWISEIIGIQFFSEMVNLLLSVIVLALVLSAKMGVKKWKILISSFT